MNHSEYQVALEHDGCHVRNVYRNGSHGSREECAKWISNHLPPNGRYSFGIVEFVSGRQVSFLIPPATVGRRTRLKA